MSKQDRAAKAIKFEAARGYSPEQIATLLNELNLLVPDLPGLRFFPDTEEYEADVVDGYINLKGGEITVSYDERDEDTYLTDPPPRSQAKSASPTQIRAGQSPTQSSPPAT